MKIINNLLDIKATGETPRLGVTMGNFDGVHLGHRQLLSKIKQECLERNLRFAVVTFIPHPQKILQPEKERFLINSYEKRRQLLEEAGVDYLVEMKFTRDFSTLSAEEFVNTYMLPYPKLENFYLGYDFAFGANKKGGSDLVKEICLPNGINVEIQPAFEFDGQIVSSTLIRQFLMAGAVDKVATILARPYQLEGVVIKGEGRGKKIGFPTANVQVSSDLIVPGKGVYITRTIYKGMTYNSVTNIGQNPTFKDTDQIHIETNLFDFDLDIYGEQLEIQFLKKIRDERKFPTVNDLIGQIKHDVEEAKAFLK
jgi:riboflavin kinase/FMN adenylyltransferase